MTYINLNVNIWLKGQIRKMYGFERLKHFKDEYCSFNLGKNKGVIRLIFKVDKVNNVVILEHISMEHYTDFKRKKGIMG